MDAGQRSALADFVRQTLAADLDELHHELDRLRQELGQMRTVFDPKTQRRLEVVQRREAGESVSRIAAATNASKGAIYKDLAFLRLPAARVSVDIHGIVRHHRNGAGQPSR